MGLTQPAVSSAVKRLEKQIGKSLFVKKGRGIELTPSAAHLVNHFRHGIETIENAIYNIESFNVASSEVILHAIQQPTSNVTFQESLTDKNQLLEELRQQKIDLAIDTILIKDASFIVEELYREPMVIICRYNHPRIQGSISKEQFYNEKHCLFVGRWNNLTGVEQLAREPIHERKIDLITCSNASAALHVSQRDSLAAIPKSFALKWAKMLKLQVCEPPIELDDIPYQYIYHRRNLHNKWHIEMRRQIKTQLNSLKSILESSQV